MIINIAFKLNFLCFFLSKSGTPFIKTILLSFLSTCERRNIHSKSKLKTVKVNVPIGDYIFGLDPLCIYNKVPYLRALKSLMFIFSPFFHICLHKQVVEPFFLSHIHISTYLSVSFKYYFVLCANNSCYLTNTVSMFVC